MKNKLEYTKGERVFCVFNYIFLTLLMLVMLYPMWHVLMASFSDAKQLSAHSGLLLIPDGWSLAAYKMMLKNPMILIGYKNTLIILAVGLTINMVLTTIAAYVLSRRGLKLNGFFSLFIVFTMYFSGGLIPGYRVVMDLGLGNSLLSVILPSAVSTFNLIVLRTGFASIPESLIESAKLDGAGDLRVLWKIVVPLSKANLAVILLYYAVSHWNSWFNAMLFIDDRNLYPLQLVLREILIQNDTSTMMMGIDAGDSGFISETIKYAIIIVSVVPILCVYPFIQKYFTKGVMVGAVKG